jgi:2,3-dihydroxybenzoate decarboxylase
MRPKLVPMAGMLGELELYLAVKNEIALEEHVSGPGFEKYLAGAGNLFHPSVLAAIEQRLPDFEQERLATMDATGISVAVLSQTAPGVQTEPDAATAVDMARRSNDFLAARIAENPTRFRGFAAVAVQDVDAAIAELQRLVTELGFVGVLINGNTCGRYLDETRFDPFWSALTELGVPLYLTRASTPRSAVGRAIRGGFHFGIL